MAPPTPDGEHTAAIQTDIIAGNASISRKKERVPVSRNGKESVFWDIDRYCLIIVGWGRRGRAGAIRKIYGAKFEQRSGKLFGIES